MSARAFGGQRHSARRVTDARCGASRRRRHWRAAAARHVGTRRSWGGEPVLRRHSDHLPHRPSGPAPLGPLLRGVRRLPIIALSAVMVGLLWLVTSSLNIVFRHTAAGKRQVPYDPWP
jgi:hypothetical protein